jgi:methionine-rich copper-binding protein CopC
MLCACVALQAWAHAFLDHAEPRVGTAVATAPAELKLWFTESIEPAFSTVKVLDANGQRVDRGDVRVEKAQPGLMRVSLAPLGPGTYKVEWRVVSVDTHVTQGNFVFRVGG